MSDDVLFINFSTVNLFAKGIFMRRIFMNKNRYSRMNLFMKKNIGEKIVFLTNNIHENFGRDREKRSTYILFIRLEWSLMRRAYNTTVSS